MKEFRVKQDLMFVVVPLVFDLLLFAGALVFTSGLWRVLLILLSLGFAGLVLWQARPILKGFELIVNPKEVIVKDFRGNTVRRIEWKRIEAAVAGYKKTWLLYTYSFYFRVKGDEDLLFALISRTPGLTGKFQQFVRVFVRKKVPVQVVKA
ncbi:hypothetical protein [Thermovibrio sp.]